MAKSSSINKNNRRIKLSDKFFNSLESSSKRNTFFPCSDNFFARFAPTIPDPNISIFINLF